MVMTICFMEKSGVQIFNKFDKMKKKASYVDVRAYRLILFALQWGYKERTLLALHGTMY